MASGLLWLGVALIVIGIIMFIAGWIWSNSTNNNNPSTVTNPPSSWPMFLVIGGVFFFIIGLILVFIGYYHRHTVGMVPPHSHAAVYPAENGFPEHAHVTSSPGGYVGSPMGSPRYGYNSGYNQGYAPGYGYNSGYGAPHIDRGMSVSYTHLTLPTILLV